MIQGKLAMQKKLIKSRTELFLFFNTTFFILFILCMGLFFRKVRDFLAPTEIGSQKIVGYTQYTGYPFNLDTCIFFVFIFAPVIIGFMICVIDKNNNEKRK